MNNPIQGPIRGEAIINGDASEGIDIVLYAVTPGWAAIGADSGMTASASVRSVGGGDYVTITVTGGAPFRSAMVGRIISFVGCGSIGITEVISPTEIRVAGDYLLMGNRAFTMEAQEGLRVVELDADDTLNITDVFVSQEKDSEYAVVEGEDAPGRRVAKGRLLEVGSINLRFDTPFIGCAQNTLKYFGHDNGLNVCLIHGYIT